MGREMVYMSHTTELRRLIGGLLMSGRPKSDSGEPDLWSNGSVFEEPRESISIDPSPHIPLQQTTAREKEKEHVVLEEAVHKANPLV